MFYWFEIVWNIILFNFCCFFYFLFDFYGHYLSISYRFRVIWLHIFRVWPWSLSSEGYMRSNCFIPFESPYMTSRLTSRTPFLYLVPFSRYSTSKFVGWFDLELWPLKVIWDQKVVYPSNAHIWLPFDYHGQHLSISYRFRDIRLQSFKGMTLKPQMTFDPKGHLGSKKLLPFERQYMTSHLTSMDTISLSRTSFEIFDFAV